MIKRMRGVEGGGGGRGGGADNERFRTHER